jgi:hypothetical protein
MPRLSLRIEDLAHPGASIFLEAVNPLTALRDAVLASFTWLYTPETVPKKLAHFYCSCLASCRLASVSHHIDDTCSSLFRTPLSSEVYKLWS